MLVDWAGAFVVYCGHPQYFLAFSKHRKISTTIQRRPFYSDLTCIPDWFLWISLGSTKLSTWTGFGQVPGMVRHPSTLSAMALPFPEESFECS